MGRKRVLRLCWVWSGCCAVVVVSQWDSKDFKIPRWSILSHDFLLQIFYNPSILQKKNIYKRSYMWANRWRDSFELFSYCSAIRCDILMHAIVTLARVGDDGFLLHKLTQIMNPSSGVWRRAIVRVTVNCVIFISQLCCREFQSTAWCHKKWM